MPGKPGHSPCQAERLSTNRTILRQAIASSPNWFKPHWMLAQVLMTKGHREQALAEGRVAVDLNGGKNPEVARVLE